jgi:ankyrin repeat protein
MSAPHSGSVFDALRAQAKQQLALARNGDGVVIAALRESLPRLASVSDATFATQVLLADVQHALARQRGHKSWAELKRTIDATDPVELQAERFLQAVRDNSATRAGRILRDTPAVAHYSVHAAAAACNHLALQAFLTADPALAVANTVTTDTRDVIHFACATPLVNVSDVFMSGSARCVELLLQHGANANSSIPYGNDGVRVAVLYFASATNNIHVVRMLLNAGANPNDGESIYHAGEHNFRDVMQLLVEGGCDVDSRSGDYDNTPLYFLAGYRPFNALCAPSELGMAWLLNRGADPNVPSYTAPKYHASPSSGETPLHRVAEFGKGVDIARALVAHGANVNSERRDGRTPHALAVRTGNTAVAEYLVTVGAITESLSDVDRLLGACAVADTQLAQRIVAGSPDILHRLGAHDHAALALAAEEGRIDSVRLMASLGWDLNEELGSSGTALHHAAWQGRIEMSRMLIALGAPINARDKHFGSSPIAWAAHGSVNARPGNDDEYIAVIGMLLDAGATREPSYNNWKEPPENLGSKAVAKYLRQRGFSA